MLPGERFKKWIDGLAESWKDRLRGWLLRAIGEGITKFTGDLEPGLKEMSREYMDILRANPALPPEIKRQIDHALGAGNILEVIYLEFTMLLGAIGAILGGSTPIANEMRYAQDYMKRSSRLDPLSVIAAWRRDKPTYEKYFDDLREQGWSEDRIEALKFVTLYYPPPVDLVRWQAREVFEPKMIARYGLDDELGEIEREPFYKAGMTDEQITNYWRAHWEHASWLQVVEMVRRGQMTEADVWDWFRLVEIPPFWRDKLINISWEVPTRVDVRRFWDMRTIDEARLREIYTAQGYHGKDLEDYVLWTKIYVDFPDLITRFKNGWLTLEDVRSELLKLGMSDERAEELIQTKVKAAASEKLAKDKDLTAAEIIKGVKKGVITYEQGLELLMDLGYDDWEAEFKLAIELAVATGSPETYSEFKDLTEKWLKATGRLEKPMPEELKKAADEVVRLTKEVEALERSITEERRGLLEEEVLPEETTARLTELQVTRNRAVSELERVKSEYARLLAEWKYGTQA